MEVAVYTTRPPAETAQARAPGLTPRSAGRLMPVALLAALTLQASEATLADLERAYDETCNGRILGQYDGMCSSMAEQVKSYRAELKRRPHPRPPPPPAAASASPGPPAEPSTPHEPAAGASPKT